MVREERGKEKHPEDNCVVDLESADVSHDPNRGRFGIRRESERAQPGRESG
jgi:hypothetical protein